MKAISGFAVTSRAQLAAAVQTQCIVGQLERTLSSLDSRLMSLLKITVYLRDMDEFPCVYRVLQSALGADPPAITVLAVADLPLAHARVQIEAVAL
jgi:2-iminobutanoate/2-iminopropanoate deaminase